MNTLKIILRYYGGYDLITFARLPGNLRLRHQRK